ncbi:F-box/FBD/LRR-repeat protein At1g13570-like isoform X1 [Triticum dicoccoides]|uniref:F-box/FBD/LRR-repeat protein At1g13570-like isoform X1 n=1 Tax=Triticum dicoccoides TaxID=85692 RepID=UPI000E799BC2|nr:F-box/FBD/LRR-repeat protein At1g13570-like isoform X1 [Triticum dicoccoides]
MAAAVGDDLLLDRLSDLPAIILVTILSRLDMDEAARCSILSSRWRRLFPSTLLDFKAGSIRRDRAVEAVTSILAAHPTEPVRSFSTYRLSFRRQDEDAVDGWLRDLANRGIEKLVLYFNEKRQQKVPESLFACASLKRLKVINGTFPDATEAAASLAVLAKIDLSDVKISEDSLNSLLSNCRALERLKITSISKCDRLHIRSRSLKVLNTSGDFKELFIDDAPDLEQVLGYYLNSRSVIIKIAHAPKLEFLGYIGMNNDIEFGNTKFTKFREKNIHAETIMPSLKTLAVDLMHTPDGHINEHYINWVMQLLKVFPCLETIYIKSDSWSEARDGSPGSWDVLSSVPCMDNHLEKVVFEVYRGQEWQRDMAKFLHGRSRFLKTMEFHCMDDTSREDYGRAPTEEWVRKQQELLCLDSRAARDARFLFFKSQLVVNHHEFSHNESYQRGYYRDMYNL